MRCLALLVLPFVALSFRADHPRHLEDTADTEEFIDVATLTPAAAVRLDGEQGTGRLK
jgi:hypothetical protein